MSAARRAPGYAAPLTCPSCGRAFRARWLGVETADQRCPSCGHVFEATWPGFTLKSETVVVGAGDGGDHAA